MILNSDFSFAWVRSRFLHGVNGTAPGEWLLPSAANDMHFRVPASAVKNGGEVSFVPYFEVADELMTVYPAYDV